MSKTARALFHQLIDYAGLFPPAKLEMDEATENFARYAAGEHAWMLARFICPVSRLREMEAAAPADMPSFRVSALGGAGEEIDAWNESLVGGAADAAAFTADNRLSAVVDALETRLPTDLATEPALVDELRALQGVLRERAPSVEALYLELPRGKGWRDRVGAVATAVSGLTQAPRLGLKIRTGGVDPGAVPSVIEVAAFIAAAAASRVPFKATAGLHHPLRHFRPEFGADMHGFLNVFAAAAFAWQGALDFEQLCRLLDERDPQAIRLSDDGLSWSSHRLPLDVLPEARNGFAQSVGSCSFTEPLDDLSGLGLL